MVINSNNVNGISGVVATKVNTQMDSKLARQESLNREYTELPISMESSESFLPPETSVMTGLTAMADVYRAFEHSFSSALDPIIKQVEKDREELATDPDYSPEEKAELMEELTQSFGYNVKATTENLSTAYNSMLRGLKQLYYGEGLMEQVLSQYGNFEEINLSLSQLKLEHVDSEIALDEMKASIEQARQAAKRQQQNLSIAGQDFAKVVTSPEYESATKPSESEVFSASNNIFSKMMTGLIYSSIASPYQTYNNALQALFNLSTHFSRYNILV